MDRFTPYCAVHLLLIKNNEILLLRRNNTGWQDGNYSVPAGHINGSETATAAIMRETFEEINIRLKPEELHMIHVMHRLTESGLEYIDFFFIASDWYGEIKNNEPNKCDDLSWFKIATLPSNTVSYIKEAIEHFKNKKIYSEQGWTLT